MSKIANACRQRRSVRRSEGSAYLVTVAVLMLVAIVLLSAMLWRERSSRAQSESDALGVIRSLQSDMATLAMRQEVEGSDALVRGDLPIISVDINGVATRMLIIGPEVGRSIGLVPGDLVMVMNREPGVGPAETEPAEE